MVKSAGGKAGEAYGMFDPQIFSKEKQPDQVRQAWIEVQLQQLISMAHSGKCEQALKGLFWLGDEDPRLSFTLDGFDRFMKLAHFQYYAATIESSCHADASATKRLSSVSKMRESLPSLEFAFPLLAAAKLGSGAAQAKIDAALESVRAALAASDQSSEPVLMYLQALLLETSGKPEEAMSQLQQAVNSGDPMIQYLALTEINQIFATK
jgi:hypothetical protein